MKVKKIKSEKESKLTSKRIDANAFFENLMTGSPVGAGEVLSSDALSEDRLQHIAAVKEDIIDNKGAEIKTYKCRLDYFVEYVIVATGTSSRHMAGICEKVRLKLKSDFGIVAHVDDRSQEWLVMDLGFAMVHVLNQTARDRYMIDDLLLKLGNTLVVD